MTLYAAAQSSAAGIITAFGSWFAGIALVISAYALYRKQTRVEKIAVATYHMVDGNLTAAKVSELSALRAQLAALRIVAGMAARDGIVVSAEDEAAIAHLVTRIATLNTEIVGRRAQDSSEKSLAATVADADERVTG